MTYTLDHSSPALPEGHTAAGSPADGQSRLVRLLVVDGHPIVRWAMAQVANGQRDLTAVGEAAAAGEALALVYSLRPDVVAVDCTAADGDGWELARRLRTDYPRLGIVVLASDASDRMLFRALNMGASAFVSKSAAIPDVLAAIRHAAVAPDSFTAAGLAEALRRQRAPREHLALSPREHQILVLLHDGLSVPAIAANLYVSLSTAKTYVARLYEKLEARNRAQALMTAVRLGLLEEQLTAG